MTVKRIRFNGGWTVDFRVCWSPDTWCITCGWFVVRGRWLIRSWQVALTATLLLALVIFLFGCSTLATTSVVTGAEVVIEFPVQCAKNNLVVPWTNVYCLTTF